jgi:hypothetical protein
MEVRFTANVRVCKKGMFLSLPLSSKVQQKNE